MALLLLYIFIGIIVTQAFYYLGIFTGFAFSKPSENNPKKIPVSVIVQAKNQAEEMKKLLPVLLNQNYHTFELVLVNNASTDETLDVFKEFASYVPYVRIVNVQNNEAFWGSKKYALTLGIKASSYEYLLFLDGKDHIGSPDWILQMSSHFTLNKTIVMGVSQYPKTKGFFNKFLRFDLAFSQLQSFAWSKLGQPFSTELPNLGYKKEVFYNVNGFIDHMNIANFTNELFLNQAATHKNTAICEWNEVAVTLTAPKNFSSFSAIKKRQSKLLSTYAFSQQFKIRLFNCSLFAFYLIAILLLILQTEWIITTALIVFRFILAWAVTAKSLQKFRQRDVVWLFPILEPVQIFIQLNVFMSNLGSKSKL